MTSVIEHAEADGKRFLAAIRDMAVGELGRSGSPVKPTPKRLADVWTAKAKLIIKYARAQDEPFLLSLALDTSAASVLGLYASVWRKGGATMGAALADVLAGAYHGRSTSDEDWDSGSAVLCIIPFDDHLEGPDGVLNLDSLAKAFDRVLKAQTNPVLEAMVNAGRSRR